MSKVITFAHVVKATKEWLDICFKLFKQNPSAANYDALQKAMLAYQDALKN